MHLALHISDGWVGSTGTTTQWTQHACNIALALTANCVGVSSPTLTYKLLRRDGHNYDIAGIALASDSCKYNVCSAIVTSAMERVAVIFHLGESSTVRKVWRFDSSKRSTYTRKQIEEELLSLFPDVEHKGLRFEVFYEDDLVGEVHYPRNMNRLLQI